MTEQEKINTEVQTKLTVHDEKFDAFLHEMQNFKDEMKDFKDEMRDRDNQRHSEIQALDGKIESIRQSVQSIQESSRNQTIVTFLGIAAMVVAVLLK